MTEKGNRDEASERVRAKIVAAFPDFIFTGPITGVDENPAEELDEEQDLYSNLSGRRWSEIPADVLDRNVDGYHLLTDAAFVAFLPAWLNRAITSDEAREFIAYTFEPRYDPKRWLDRRIRQLSYHQMEAVQMLLAFCIEFEPSSWVKEHTQNALARVAALMAD